MGRIFQFECSKCAYRVRLTGGGSSGATVAVQTIHCHDCRALYDAVVRIKLADTPRLVGLSNAKAASALAGAARVKVDKPPRFPAVLNRLPPNPLTARWAKFAPACPVVARHRITPWSSPGKCPKCGAFLEPSPLPYRVWD